MQFCIKYSNTFVDSANDNHNLENYKIANHKLHTELNSWKNKITQHGDWNKSKKLTNVYEQILTKHLKKPVSRSYYKLWEIAHDFSLLRYHDISKKTLSVHIAEGPGGFIESLCDLYIKNHFDSRNHTIHGITLLSPSSTIPNWKIPAGLFKKFNINLHNSTNGDLYDVRTIDTFTSELKQQKADLITADGGFDFSDDFNTQELQFQLLMLSQIYCAIRAQKQSGTFLLKVFDLFSAESILLLAICSRFFDSFTVIKPKTSRPANSEKYIIFTGFKTESENIDTELVTLTSMLRHAVIHQNLEGLKSICNTSYYREVYRTITLYNIVYTVKQILCLKETISLNDCNTDKNELLRHNSKECKRWREEYKLIY